MQGESRGNSSPELCPRRREFRIDGNSAELGPDALTKSGRNGIMTGPIRFGWTCAPVRRLAGENHWE